ncbi:hypothetical protein VPH35_049316 [Triticum aestivum]
MSTLASRIANDPARGIGRMWKTRCLIEESQEAIGEEARLRESALVITVAGTRPALVPAHISEAILADFPDMPQGDFQVSLMRPGSFFVRFAHRRWFDLVREANAVHYRGTPLLVRRWNRWTFATSVQCRYSVRLFIQGIPPQEFSLQTAQDLLPECQIYQVAIKSFDKLDLSYFVVRAWVDDPDEVPTETVLTVCPDLLAHVSLPPGFDLEGDEPEAFACTEHLPRVLRYPPVLIHLDTVTFYPPRPANVAILGGGGGDEEGAPPPEEMPHPWQDGIADDITRTRTGFGLTLAERRAQRGSGGPYSGRYHRVPGVLQPEDIYTDAAAVADPADFHVRARRESTYGVPTANVHVHGTLQAAPPEAEGVLTANPSGPVTGDQSTLAVTAPGPLADGYPAAAPAAGCTPLAGPAGDAALHPLVRDKVVSRVRPTAEGEAVMLVLQDGGPLSPPMMTAICGVAANQDPGSSVANNLAVGRSEELTLLDLDPPLRHGTPTASQLAPTVDGHAETQTVLCSKPTSASMPIAGASLALGNGPTNGMGQMGPGESRVLGPCFAPTTSHGCPSLLRKESEDDALTKQIGDTDPFSTPGSCVVEDAIQDFISRVTQPPPQPLLANPRPPTRRPRKAARPPATATRRSNRLHGKNLLFAEGSTVMKQARLLVMSKRGLAIPERDEVEESRIERYAKAFDEPLSPQQIKALQILARTGKQSVMLTPSSA